MRFAVTAFALGLVLAAGTAAAGASKPIPATLAALAPQRPTAMTPVPVAQKKCMCLASMRCVRHPVLMDWTCVPKPEKPAGSPP